MTMFPLVSPLPIVHGINRVYQHEITSPVFDFAEQFQNLTTQPHAMFVSSIEGLTPSNLSSISERQSRDPE
jgi:hypothetical protein